MVTLVRKAYSRLQDFGHLPTPVPVMPAATLSAFTYEVCIQLKACADNNTINTFQQALPYENFAGQQRKELLREWLFLAQQPLCIPTSTHALALTSSNQTQPVTTRPFCSPRMQLL